MVNVLTEQRQVARKILKTKAVLVVEGEGAVTGRTSDVSANGLSVAFPDPLKAGQAGQLTFDVFVDGKITTIKARAKSLYCILSGGQFKVGFQFLNLELAAMTALARFLR